MQKMNLQAYIVDLQNRFDAETLYYGHGTDNSADEAMVLALVSLGIDYPDSDEALNLILQERQLSDAEIEGLDASAEKRLRDRTPLAYVLGKTWFAGYEFACDPRALIPRSPIAELIENKFEPLLPELPAKILDLCCGGGCIGLAAALEFNECQVDLADISSAALDLARENIDMHGLQQRVSTIESDIFASISDRYDLILANPPYVSMDEFNALPAEYRHEPALGLVSNDEGLELPLQILAEAADYLNPNGILIMEVGFSGQALTKRLNRVPLLWLDFEHGGEGVLMLTREQLLEYQDAFI